MSLATDPDIHRASESLRRIPLDKMQLGHVQEVLHRTARLRLPETEMALPAHRVLSCFKKATHTALGLMGNPVCDTPITFRGSLVSNLALGRPIDPESDVDAVLKFICQTALFDNPYYFKDFIEKIAVQALLWCDHPNEPTVLTRGADRNIACIRPELMHLIDRKVGVFKTFCAFKDPGRPHTAILQLQTEKRSIDLDIGLVFGQACDPLDARSFVGDAIELVVPEGTLSQTARPYLQYLGLHRIDPIQALKERVLIVVDREMYGGLSRLVYHVTRGEHCQNQEEEYTAIYRLLRCTPWKSFWDLMHKKSSSRGENFSLYFVMNAYTISLLLEAHIQRTQPDEGENKLNQVKEFQRGLIETRSEYLHHLPPWAQGLFGSNPGSHPLDPIVKMAALSTHLSKHLDNTVRESLGQQLRICGDKTGVYVQSMSCPIQALLAIIDELMPLIPEEITKLIQHIPSLRPIEEKCRFLFFIRRMQQKTFSLEEHGQLVEHLPDILFFLMRASNDLAQHREWKEWPKLLEKFIGSGYEIPSVSTEEIQLCQTHKKITAPLLLFFLTQHQKLAEAYLHLAADSLLKDVDWILGIYETAPHLASGITVSLLQHPLESTDFIDQIRDKQPVLALYCIPHLKEEIQLKIFLNDPEKWSRVILERGTDLTPFTHLFLDLDTIPQENVHICRFFIRSLIQLLDKKTRGSIEPLIEKHLPFLHKRRKLQGLKELPRYPFLIQQLYKQNIKAQRELIEQEYMDVLSGKSHIEEFLLSSSSDEDVGQLLTIASSLPLPAEWLDPLALRIKEKAHGSLIDLLRWAENSGLDQDRLIPYIMITREIIEGKTLDQQLEYLRHLTEQGYPNTVLQEHFRALKGSRLLFKEERSALIGYTALIVGKSDLIESFIEQITQPSFAGQEIDNYLILFDVVLQTQTHHPTHSYTRWLIQILEGCPCLLSTGNVINRLRLSDLPLDLHYFQLLQYLITQTRSPDPRVRKQVIGRMLIAELERLDKISLPTEEIIAEYAATKHLFIDTYLPENVDSSWYVQEVLDQIDHRPLPSLYPMIARILDLNYNNLPLSVWEKLFSLKQTLLSKEQAGRAFLLYLQSLIYINKESITPAQASIPPMQGAQFTIEAYPRPSRKADCADMKGGLDHSLADPSEDRLSLQLVVSSTRGGRTTASVLISKEYQEYLGSEWPAEVYVSAWEMGIKYQDLSLIRYLSKVRAEGLSSMRRKKIGKDCLHLTHKGSKEDSLPDLIKMVFTWIKHDFCVEHNEALLLALIEKLQYQPKKDNLSSIITYLPVILSSQQGIECSSRDKKTWEGKVRHCFKDLSFEAYIQAREFFLVPHKNGMLDTILHQLFTHFSYDFLKDLCMEDPSAETFEKLWIFNSYLLSHEFNAAKLKPQTKLTLQLRLESLSARFELGSYHTSLKSAYAEHFVLFAEVVLHLSQHDIVKLTEASGRIERYLDSLCFQEYIENTGFFLITANHWLTYKGFKHLFVKFSRPVMGHLSNLSLIERDTLYHITSMNTLLMQSDVEVPPPPIEEIQIWIKTLNEECLKYLKEPELPHFGLKNVGCLAATYFCLAEKIGSKRKEVMLLKAEFYEEWKMLCLTLVTKYEETKNPELLIGLIEIGRVWHLHQKPNPIDRQMVKEVFDRIDQYYVLTLVVHYERAARPTSKEDP